MCGIIGYTGTENAIPIVLRGLSALEYRGYDSAGIGYFQGGKLCSIKEQGKLYRLREKIDTIPGINSTCAIGHTRWATHGEPTDVNAHPHGTENILLVHNGIIENCEQIKNLLRDNGYDFLSATDTEVAAKLIDFCFVSSKDPLRAIWQALDLIEGAYAIAAIFKGHPGEIYAFRNDNPLIAVVGKESACVASDVAAVTEDAKEYFAIDQGEIALVSQGKVQFVTSDGKTIVKKPQKVELGSIDASKENFEHFMLKEIFEEPEAIEKTVSKAVSNGAIQLNIDEQKLKGFENIHIVACGTAYHAGLVGKGAIESLARVPVRVYYASEFRYTEPILGDKDLVIAVSQSGETADTLGAMRLAKYRGIYTFAIVNAQDSALCREADSVFVTEAGREVSVASTKAYHVQLAALYLMAIKLAVVRGSLPFQEADRLTHALLNDIPSKIQNAIANRERCEAVAKKYMDSGNMFFIGRGIDVAQSKEAALKMKEISYIHCHAFAAGELKHGSIALVEQGTPVVAIITSKNTLGKMVSNLQEVKARGAHIIAIVAESTPIPAGLANDIIYLPDAEELFMPMVCATATQLMAYYMSVNLGNDVDKPRNLAKSVTVE